MGNDEFPTSRQALAEGVLLALLSNPARDYHNFKDIAHDAVKYADALLAELARTASSASGAL